MNLFFFQQSGFGRDGGREGLFEYAKVKAFHHNKDIFHSKNIFGSYDGSGQQRIFLSNIMFDAYFTPK